MVSETHNVLMVMYAIAQVETGYSEKPFNEVSIPSKNGDRAYGKWQIMGNNIAAWGKEAGFNDLSIETFLHNPGIQKAVVFKQIQGLLKKYSPNDVASIWFSGRPMKQAGDAKDAYGTTVPEYVKKFAEAYKNYSDKLTGTD